MKMNHGKVISVLAAGQAGMFHVEEGRWPRDRADLITHGCPRLDDATAELGRSVDERPSESGCQFFFMLPYTLELQRRAGNLRMVLRNQSDKLVCKLVVVAPYGNAREALIPQIVLKTTWFSCPGEGKSLQ